MKEKNFCEKKEKERNNDLISEENPGNVGKISGNIFKNHNMHSFASFRISGSKPDQTSCPKQADFAQAPNEQ